MTAQAEPFSPPDDTNYELFENFEYGETEEDVLHFPGYGNLEITFEQTDQRRALGLRPAPVITCKSPNHPETIFSPQELIIRDELGNLYEVVPRRSSKFNSPEQRVDAWNEARHRRDDDVGEDDD